MDKREFKPSDWVEEFKRVLKTSGNIFAFTSYNLLGKWYEAFDHHSIDKATDARVAAEWA